MTDEYRDWKVILTFSVPAGDTEGVLTEAILEAAYEHAPSEAAGIVASADTDEGKVWVVFTMPDSTREFAQEVAKTIRKPVMDTGTHFDAILHSGAEGNRTPARLGVNSVARTNRPQGVGRAVGNLAGSRPLVFLPLGISVEGSSWNS